MHSVGLNETPHKIIACSLFHIFMCNQFSIWFFLSKANLSSKMKNCLENSDMKIGEWVWDECGRGWSPREDTASYKCESRALIHLSSHHPLTFEGFQTVYQSAFIYSFIICKTGAHTSQPSEGQYKAAVSAGRFSVIYLINSSIFWIPRVQRQGIEKNFRAYM